MRIVLAALTLTIGLGSAAPAAAQDPVSFLAATIGDTNHVAGKLHGLYLLRGPHLMVLTTHEDLAVSRGETPVEIVAIQVALRRLSGTVTPNDSPRGMLRMVRWNVPPLGLEASDTLSLVVVLPDSPAGSYRLEFNLFDVHRRVVSRLRVFEPVRIPEGSGGSQPQ